MSSNRRAKSRAMLVLLVCGMLTACTAPSQPPAAAPAASPPAAITELPGQSLYHLDASLTDQHGTTLTLASFGGRPVLIAMFYASCTTVCPILIEQMHRIDAALSAEEKAGTQVLLVSLDPDHDSVERLAELAKQHGISDARWHFTRTPAASVQNIAAVLGLAYRRTSDGTIGHSASIFLLDRGGVIAAQLDGSRGDSSEFARSLARAVASVGPLRRSASAD